MRHPKRLKLERKEILMKGAALIANGKVRVDAAQTRTMELMRHDLRRKTPDFPALKLEKGEQPLEADKLSSHLRHKRRKHFLPTMPAVKYAEHKAKLRAKGPTAEKASV